MNKFQITITETDEGLQLSFIDFENKQKADLGITDSKSTVGILSKIIMSQVQQAHYTAALIVPDYTKK
jgi:hypothetical protein